MKYAIMVIGFIPFLAFSQMEIPKSDSQSGQSGEFRISKVEQWLETQKTPVFNVPANHQIDKLTYRSPLKSFTQDQFLMNVYPDSDLSNLTNIVFGSFTSQNFSIGNLKLSQDYLFDTDGNLTSSQFSIRMGTR